MRLKNRLRGPGRRGATMVETAIALSVFFLFFFATVDVARLGMASQLLTNAAREGCRVAVIPGSTQTDVQNKVNAMLGGSGIPSPTATPSPGTWQNNGTMGAPITVKLTVPFSQVSWFSPPKFFGSAQIMTSATMSSERP